MKLFTSIVFMGMLALAQAQPLSERMAATVMNTWKDSFALGGGPARWSYDMGVVLKGFEGIWQHTGNGRYFNYIQQMMDVFIQEDGSIKDYKAADYNIDHINNGKLALLLYKVTGKEKYLKAANLLRDQLRTHPRTREGGFWHKKIYPYQMWLDGLYMGEPFYAEYAQMAHEDSSFNDIANQFIWMEQHARNANTGLLYHAWDESRQQPWANKQTGLSPHVWARAMGWYGVALVDVLDWFPPNHPKRKDLLAILNRFVTAIEKVQDKNSGLWYDIIDMPKEKGNYFEASAAAMFVFTVAKAVRLGYISSAHLPVAAKGYKGIVQQFIKVDSGQTNLYGTVKVSGLGGKPYRDGSFAYYMSEPVIVNDPKGVGAFILASNEMEMLPTLNTGKGKKVLLDYFFNNE
ncbi:MAG TPA: glycoside hydrolase family 88 protein, partial [Chitinophagaceae bacterium]|nr:glycoside hydrolase family 88 protein [Chitinophagaceae bacterium]